MKRFCSIIMILSMFVFMTACGTSGVDASGGMASGSAGEIQKEMASESSVTESLQTDAGSLGSEELVSPGHAAQGDLLSEEEAKIIALEDAGISEDQISGIYIHLDRDNNIWEYEVEFYVDDQEYDYEIIAVDGVIREKDRETENLYRKDDVQNAAIISQDEATKLVLSKVPGAVADQIRIHLDKDDGAYIYEGSLVHDGMEYEFEISAGTGRVVEWDVDRYESYD